MATPYPGYYRLSVVATRPDVVFRVSEGGRFERLQGRSWVHVADPGGRDYLSRAIEGGDAVRLPAAVR
jgi:hypothetical protein